MKPKDLETKINLISISIYFKYINSLIIVANTTIYIQYAGTRTFKILFLYKGGFLYSKGIKRLENQKLQ